MVMTTIKIPLYLVDEAWEWCEENIKQHWWQKKRYEMLFDKELLWKYLITPFTERGNLLMLIPIVERKQRIVYFQFRNEIDAMAFKLRWL